MKEKIENVIKFIEGYVIECPITAGCGRCNEARQHVAALKEGLKDVNQEVEKRIAERMPSEEEINKQAEQAMQRDTKDGRIGIIIDSTYYGVFCDALEWLRSRLTNPESSQKTEGGGE